MKSAGSGSVNCVFFEQAPKKGRGEVVEQWWSQNWILKSLKWLFHARNHMRLNEKRHSRCFYKWRLKFGESCRISLQVEHTWVSWDLPLPVYAKMAIDSQPTNQLQTGWWLGHPLKNMSSSIGMMIPNIWEHKKWQPTHRPVANHS